MHIHNVRLRKTIREAITMEIDELITKWAYDIAYLLEQHTIIRLKGKTSPTQDYFTTLDQIQETALKTALKGD